MSQLTTVKENSRIGTETIHDHDPYMHHEIVVRHTHTIETSWNKIVILILQLLILLFQTQILSNTSYNCIPPTIWGSLHCYNHNKFQFLLNMSDGITELPLRY